MAVLMIRKPKKKVPAFGEDSCLWVCLRYQVAPLRCLSILGSGKDRQIFSNLKHYEQGNFGCWVDFNAFTSFSYVYCTNLVSGYAIC